ncbi:MAG: hypothetical protein KGI93_05515 [Acidobacteriota bacterium]|nr:hypothetical protein [Acidobacteriota bacterium]MDE3190734.1 hypothetical protein [Acidobacteriota bacterium]
MSDTRTHRKTKVLVAVAALAALAIATGAPTASAAPAATLKATSSCWLDVVNDWLAHGTVKNLYAIPCYTQAVQHLSAYPDIKQYSSAIDDINRAKLNAIREERNGAVPGPGGGNGPGSGPPGGGGGNGGNTGGGTAGTHKSLLKTLAADLGPGNAQSIPLPLLVLGGLAVLLLLAAAGTWLARRLQARRVTPAPAVAKRR